MIRVATPTSTQDFLRKVGYLSIGIIAMLSLLHLLSPSTDKLICEHPGVVSTGEAARGRGTKVITTMRLRSGDPLFTREIFTETFTCDGVFGEGWTDVR